MKKEPVLVVMAAGMGSRYGGLKQIDPVGSKGEAILDYSIYDAHQAGFETVVIIIKEAIKNDFMETVGARLKNAPVEIRYAYQELEKLPAGYSIPEGRTKPFGTGHAVLCAKEAIDGAPFAVINADDYYGKSAYKTIYDALCKVQDGEKADWCMVGYMLGNTVTDHGSVARGVCQTDEMGMLTEIIERTRIEKYEDGIRFTEDGGETWEFLPGDTIVSMNLWGFTAAFIDQLWARFPAFLDKSLPANPLKCEYFLPFVVDEQIAEGSATARVLPCEESWYGVTYKEDLASVENAIAQMKKDGIYKEDLWA